MTNDEQGGKLAENNIKLFQINNFVADNTNNKIEELLTDDSINPLTKMILVNAVYFKGNLKFYIYISHSQGSSC